MKFKYINSTELPNIDAHIKECINSGHWFLFKSPASSSQGITYFLKVGKELYGLDESGNILSDAIPTNIAMEELYYFSDIKKPLSLSNQFVA